MKYSFAITALSFCLSFDGSSSKSLDDAISSLRGSGKASMIASASDLIVPGGSLIQTNGPKKPLSVAEFTEWLHNLYYTEEQKRQSAIKSLLDTDPLA
jgi:hypothetical protein